MRPSTLRLIRPPLKAERRSDARQPVGPRRRWCRARNDGGVLRRRCRKSEQKSRPRRNDISRAPRREDESGRSEQESGNDREVTRGEWRGAPWGAGSHCRRTVGDLTTRSATEASRPADERARFWPKICVSPTNGEVPAAAAAATVVAVTGEPASKRAANLSRHSATTTRPSARTASPGKLGPHVASQTHPGRKKTRESDCIWGNTPEPLRHPSRRRREADMDGLMLLLQLARPIPELRGRRRWLLPSLAGTLDGLPRLLRVPLAILLLLLVGPCNTGGCSGPSCRIAAVGGLRRGPAAATQSDDPLRDSVAVRRWLEI